MLRFQERFNDLPRICQRVCNASRASFRAPFLKKLDLILRRFVRSYLRFNEDRCCISALGFLRREDAEQVTESSRQTLDLMPAFLIERPGVAPVQLDHRIHRPDKLVHKLRFVHANIYLSPVLAVMYLRFLEIQVYT